MKIGLIGCGNISETYFNSQKIFNNYEIVACADINLELSKKYSNIYKLKAQSVDDLLDNKEVELILNLTIPSAHIEIISRSLNAGKHCYSEKPLSINFNDGLKIKKISDEMNLYVGCAPDTFLGSAGQKAKTFIENQSLGKIILGTFNIMSHGMEDWHPNPDFFFKPGAGPVFDLGVYYITQLVNLLGPIKSINSFSSTGTKERIIKSKPRFGEKILVETPTTLMGILEFHSDTKIQFFCSWDIWNHKHTNIELYGLDGSMILPDPNFFSGDILISNQNDKWQTIKTNDMLLGIPNKDDGEAKVANYRGIGLSDMVNSIYKNIQPRCCLNLSLHVLEVLEGIILSAKNDKKYYTTTKCEKPKLLNEEEIKNLKII